MSSRYHTTCVVVYDMSPNYHIFLCWCLWYVHCLSPIFVLLVMTCLLIIIHFCAGGYGMSTVYHLFLCCWL